MVMRPPRYLQSIDDSPAALTSAALTLRARRLARRLGWVSVALGTVELLAPGVLARAVGTRGSWPARVVTRALGVRQLTSGIGILTTPRPTTWLSSRVAGDVMDLGLLLTALASPSARRSRLLAAAAAVVGVAVLDARCAERLSAPDGPTGRAVRARRSITVNRPAEELYRFWRDLSNLPTFMDTIESVRVTADRRSHWIATGPLGLRFEWEAEVVEERPNHLIAWRSIAGSEIDTGGSVSFRPAPGGRGTEVTVELEYTPPGRELTAQLVKLIGQAPEQQLRQDLRRFKQLMETGQILIAHDRTDSMSGRSGHDQRRHPGPVRIVAGGGR
jgi:uncharacterized membrane protein